MKPTIARIVLVRLEKFGPLLPAIVVNVRESVGYGGMTNAAPWFTVDAVVFGDVYNKPDELIPGARFVSGLEPEPHDGNLRGWCWPPRSP